MTRQTDGSQTVQLIARLDFKEFSPIPDDRPGEPWPPIGWSDVGIQVQRRDAQQSGPTHQLSYDSVGVTNYSVASLATSIFNAHARLDVRSATNSAESWLVPPPNELRTKMQDGEDGYVRLVDGNLVFQSHQVVRSQDIPDTSLSLAVTHPGTVIEKGLWEVFGLLFVLAIAGALVLWYFATRLLKPIFDLSRKSRWMLQYSSGEKSEPPYLPYADRHDEIGTLSNSFNELLRETYRRAIRERNERIARDDEENRRRLTELRNREENLKIIGHEIRSPLQALMSLNPAGSESRHYIERMYRALPHLQGSAGAEAALSARSIQLESIDICGFLAEIASNASLEQIPDVLYEGPTDGVACHIDDGAFEDAISNVLSNAHRHRTAGSPIKIRLTSNESTAVISISNEGENIEPAMLDQIFEYGVSTVASTEGPGTGIGLSVARNYITLMKGRISAENRTTGVSFHIQLPLLSDRGTSKGSQISAE